MTDKKELGSYPFTVEARVAIQLGRESISSSLVAIGELVKNSYDADAEEVVLTFSNLDTNFATISITDDGDGMNHNTLISKWMRIGTTHKSEIGTSTKNRVFTGAKGLGRLGLDRLCGNLNLFTKTKLDQFIFEADIKWEQYDQSHSTELDSIKHFVYEIPSSTLPDQDFPINDKNHGSQYVLSNLKDEWDEDFLIELRKELSLLLSPFSKNLDFKIKFDTKGIYQNLDGYIKSEHFLDAAEWRMKASITKNNEIALSIFDREGKQSYTSQSEKWSSWMKGWGDVPLCGPLDFELYFMKNIANKKVDTNKYITKDVRTFLKNNQGIRIYRDHFRVKPYGDPSGEGDWLGLALRRVVNPSSIGMDGWRIGYNQVVGAVFIGRETNPHLIDQTNREGLTETTAYFELRAFSLKCVELFEKHITSKEKENKPLIIAEEEISKNLEQSQNVYKDVLEKISELKLNSNDQATKTTLAVIEEKITEETERTASIKEKIDQLEAEKDTLANLASLGILFVSFGHETLGSISNAITNSDLLKTKVNEGFFMLPAETIGYANDRFNQIEKSLNYIKIFGNFSLGNVRRDKRTRRSIDILTIVKNVVTSFEGVFAKRNIVCEIQNFAESALLIKGYEIDWESIFANLITNSCWFMLDTPAEQRKIAIQLSMVEDFCVIEFEDSGSGIEAGVEGHIFKATFTTKRNKKGDSIGTGMGLSIVKTFVEAHSGGTIVLAPKGELGGARFLIKVPTVKIGD